MVNLKANDGHCHLAKNPVEHPGNQLEGCQDNISRTSIISVFKANCLVVVNLYFLEDIVLLQTFQDGSINLSKELANITGIFRDGDEAIVIQNIAFNGLVLARERISRLGLK